MEPKGYELLKIEAKITVLEKELSALFEDFSFDFNRDNSTLISSAITPVDESSKSEFFLAIKSLFL